MNTARRARLLPWKEEDGKSCYLSGEPNGYLTRVADSIEKVQLGMAQDLLAHADDLLSSPKALAGELHYLAARLTESLDQVLRVAESRGARLPDPDEEEEEEPCPRRPAN
ncbi:hypothetical protein ACF06I_12600 [Streptomyces albidoflavus]|uniref:hypothetical protein n=1 Tax=Streptomyces TaxID=1883 RepID=UPI00028300E7|nr:MULTISPECIES: hypothetical protein [unclassified Streptomyces]MYQ72926.1 hypothetical protein [Streptomyces sp. SID4934]PKA36193.1 hypothetical protein SM8_019365 [Streptomyces sp. SM8]SCE14805.1 hypothetical protein GA0115237_1095111 [Streptomyces sp. ScaeMP-6W]